MEIKYILIVVVGIGITVFEFISDIKRIKQLNRFLSKKEVESFKYVDFIVDGVEKRVGMQNGYFIHSKDNTVLYIDEVLESGDLDFKLSTIKDNQSIKVKVNEKRFEKDSKKKSVTIYGILDEYNVPIIDNDNLGEYLIKDYKKEKIQKLVLAILKPLALIGFYLIYQIFVEK